jgi:transposase InsO family protein
VLAAGGVKTILLPARSPNLNAFAERWVRSIKQECLSKLILFGTHYHGERNHQGKGDKLLSRPLATKPNNAAMFFSVSSDSEAC